MPLPPLRTDPVDAFRVDCEARVYRYKDAAAQLAISYNTLRRMVTEGEIRKTVIRGEPRIPWTEISRLIQAGMQTPAISIRSENEVKNG